MKKLHMSEVVRPNCSRDFANADEVLVHELADWLAVEVDDVLEEDIVLKETITVGEMSWLLTIIATASKGRFPAKRFEPVFANLAVRNQAEQYKDT